VLAARRVDRFDSHGVFLDSLPLPISDAAMDLQIDAQDRLHLVINSGQVQVYELDGPPAQ
jgi:hypothetical protein